MSHKWPRLNKKTSHHLVATAVSWHNMAIAINQKTASQGQLKHAKNLSEPVSLLSGVFVVYSTSRQKLSHQAKLTRSKATLKCRNFWDILRHEYWNWQIRSPRAQQQRHVSKHLLHSVFFCLFKISGGTFLFTFSACRTKIAGCAKYSFVLFCKVPCPCFFALKVPSSFTPLLLVLHCISVCGNCCSSMRTPLFFSCQHSQKILFLFCFCVGQCQMHLFPFLTPKSFWTQCAVSMLFHAKAARQREETNAIPNGTNCFRNICICGIVVTPTGLGVIKVFHILMQWWLSSTKVSSASWGRALNFEAKLCPFCQW